MRRVVMCGVSVLVAGLAGLALAQGGRAEAQVAAPRAFAQCAVCHTTTRGGPARLGPNLWGTYGQNGGKAAFSYSAAFRKAAPVWNDATLDTWLEAPAKVVPGTRMVFAGVKNPAQRKDIIAYLKTLR